MSGSSADPFLVELFRSDLGEHSKTLLSYFESTTNDRQAAEMAAKAIESAATILSFDQIAGVGAAVVAVLSRTRDLLEDQPRHAALRAVHALQELSQHTGDLATEIENRDSLLRQLQAELDYEGLLARDAAISAADRITFQTPPEAHDTSSVDDALIEIFLAELETQSNALENGLVRAETEPLPDLLESLMRAAHSIKGAARLIGLNSAVDLAHVMEDMLSSAQRREQSLTSARIDALLQSNDFFRRLSKSSTPEIRARLKEPSNETGPLVAGLRILAEGKDSPPVLRALNVSPAVTPNHPTLPDGAEYRVDTVRVLTENLSRMTALSGECLIEVQSTVPLAKDLIRINREQAKLKRALFAVRRRLDELGVSAVTELLQNATQALNGLERLLAGHIDKFNRVTGRLESIVDRLHREALACRMVPFFEGVGGFPRMVRDLARSLGKAAQLEIHGEKTQIDRDILTQLEAPVTHLLRNSVGHGIETPEVRIHAGKSPGGRIVLEAHHIAGIVEVSVADDGIGIDTAQIRQQAIGKGFASAAVVSSLSEAELLEFLFLPGFSTATQLTNISGRGVGLDVVQATLQKIGGSIRILNRPGKGCTFQMRLPLTRAVLRCLVVEICGDAYAFPLTQVESVHIVQEAEIETWTGTRLWHKSEQPLRLVQAHQILQYPNPSETSDRLTVVVIGEAPGKYGLIVDRMLGNRDLVVMPLERDFGKIPNVSAASLESARIVLLLDSKDLLESADRLFSELDRAPSEVPQIAPKPIAVTRKTILVVDDSSTVRQLQRTILTNHGYDVVLAIDGIDGWNTIQTQPPDLVITDIDMPRLNGLDLVRKIKGSLQTSHLPVIIVSYKNDATYQRQGIEAGANCYLSKSDLKDEALLKTVSDLVDEGPQA